MFLQLFGAWFDGNCDSYNGSSWRPHYELEGADYSDSFRPVAIVPLTTTTTTAATKPTAAAAAAAAQQNAGTAKRAKRVTTVAWKFTSMDAVRRLLPLLRSQQTDATTRFFYDHAAMENKTALPRLAIEPLVSVAVKTRLLATEEVLTEQWEYELKQLILARLQRRAMDRATLKPGLDVELRLPYVDQVFKLTVSQAHPLVLSLTKVIISTPLHPSPSSYCALAWSHTQWQCPPPARRHSTLVHLLWLFSQEGGTEHRHAHRDESLLLNTLLLLLHCHISATALLLARCGGVQFKPRVRMAHVPTPLRQKARPRVVV